MNYIFSWLSKKLKTLIESLFNNYQKKKNYIFPSKINLKYFYYVDNNLNKIQVKSKPVRKFNIHFIHLYIVTYIIELENLTFLS
jgi:hypothetical protein